MTIYNLMDDMCAEELDVSRQEYIDKIESTTDHRRTIIIGGLLSDNEEHRAKAKRLFNLI